MRHIRLFSVALLFLLFQQPEVTFCQTSNVTQREALRLERAAGNLWEGLLEEDRYGSPVDQRTKLDVFNFFNGARALREGVEGGQAQVRDLGNVLTLLQLQSEAVDRSFRKARIGRLMLRDWDEAKRSLNSLARLVSSRGGSPTGQARAARHSKNVNDLQIEIRKIEHVGNFFGNEYRVRGVISGRNIVSAGIYSRGQLLKPISVRLHDRRLNENSFAVRLEAREAATVRVIDSQGFVMEKAVEFPAGGLFPGLR